MISRLFYKIPEHLNGTFRFFNTQQLLYCIFNMFNHIMSRGEKLLLSL